MLRLMITGAGGLLGRALVREARARDWEVSATDAREAYILDPYAAQSVVTAERPDVLIHCMGVASPERAEREPERALQVTREAARNVAEVAARIGCVMVFPSSYRVFDGTKDGAYAPDDPPAPASAYGRAQHAAELQMESGGGRWLVVRTGWVYGESWDSPVEDLIRKAVAGQEVHASDARSGSLAWSDMLAPAILDLVVGGANGVVHVAERGAVTPYELASEVYRIAGIQTPVHPLEDVGEVDEVPEPVNGVLDVSRAEELLERPMPHWKECLERYLES